MGRLFGTDGVRGVANTELTIELAYKLGQAGAYVLTKETHHQPIILVGRDTRISGNMLEAALVAGICSVGAKAVKLGVVPTPAVAYLTRKYKADAGVVISASHNPVKYNGIKFFNSEGYKLRDELEEEIEGIILDHTEELPTPVGEEIGTIIEEPDALNDYVDFLKSTINVDLKGLKIAVDCANGAAYMAGPKVLEALGAELIVTGSEPNGCNINKNCGSTHIEALQEIVKANKVDLGLAFDGDADRCLAVDENGNLVDGDQIMAICGLQMKKENTLTGNTIVATVMSNLGLFIMAEKNGINVEKTKVGDRYVLEEMLKDNYKLGGEQSGHIIFLDYNTTGDGILTALQLLSVMKKTGKKLSELASVMEVLPQVLVNAKVSNEKKYSYLENKTVKKAIEELEAKFAGEGRVLIRPSGTEPLIRVMIEGKDEKVLKEEAEKLAELIKTELNK
ncbi:phosphoglucosamine mutase [Defluviitalea raffinosedens]|jgi:phosphoglucosamine mutase|uniref:Phosphoglucosamine mutase n=1 Tax=Defluviitalea raffinosedens TaxID=1450156 RepID=A0A7C8HGK7_9FIRM|nr:phosphoglucosamine mutase [Defluviitalea raffinosedens]KAE9636228.1 phosphoglucosamine mutase [Defluviitalea raffinosedens]MBM7684911.1 phosphoglucosamine mutase [Defluviitalea raffinosedens]MBZ4668350.1 phosphoglucosamine mutase [Defluviitaleaceae bacterium]HHW66208.1 phosphoglucosamine mutase [Candidatus Epulonipiscium sp.]